MRLNGWQRIGVVASVMWVVAGGWYEFHAIQQREDAEITARAKAADRRCRETEKMLEDLNIKSAPKDCLGEDLRTVNRATEAVPSRESRWKVAAVAILPIPFGWLIAYALIAIGRWIAAGFRLTRSN
jgi:hypothetical protein